MPASTGSAAAACWAASRIRLQTGSTERGSAAFFMTALSMALSSDRLLDTRAGRLKPPPAATLRPKDSRRNSGPSAARARLQLADQRLDLAAVVLDERIEIRAAGHDHADALDLDVGDAQALA